MVLVPTGGVIWMMRAAMDNERLAVQQRLREAYRVQLETARHSAVEHWAAQLTALDAAAGDLPAAPAFAKCVASGLADSVLVLAGDGQISYPTAPILAVPEAAPNADWHRAIRYEYVERNPAKAAEAYALAAATASSPYWNARALQAQARALLDAGDREQTIEALQKLRQLDASDAQGRSLAADAELRLLELLDADATERRVVAANLRERVAVYEGRALPAEQRLFLMHRLAELDRTGPQLPTMAAEGLAAAVASGLTSAPSHDGLTPTDVVGVWMLHRPGGRIAGLYYEDTIQDKLAAALAQQTLPAGVTLRVRPPSQIDAADFLNIPLGTTLPGWRLALNVPDGGNGDSAAQGRRAFYAWTAAAVVAATLALAWLMADAVRRQMRIAGLKNDLVATVSHELKTPLASIRLLVDSLLEPTPAPPAHSADVRTREYLELIALENSRLTRLIDNFLTFSRMERGKHQFRFEAIDARNVVAQAVAAVAHRFDGDHAILDVTNDEPLPIQGDSDALVTAVVNLLDNACKYSEGVKRVAVVTGRRPRSIEISIEDNGIGLSPTASRRVFDRFYQVDQRLSRRHGGCGLGLSIVQYIVEAHDGTVSVASQIGKRSRFTITIPLDSSGASDGATHNAASVAGAAP